MPRAFGAGVITGQPHELDLGGRLHLAYEIGQEYERAFERSDQDRRVRCVIVIDLSGDGGNAIGDLFRRPEWSEAWIGWGGRRLPVSLHR